MALVGVNVPRGQKQKPSILEKVAAGFSIAKDVLGLGLDIPEFLQNREAKAASIAQTEAQTAASKAETAPLTTTEQEAFKAAGVPEVSLPATRKQATSLASKIASPQFQETIRKSQPLSQEEKKAAQEKFGFIPENVGVLERLEISRAGRAFETPAQVKAASRGEKQFDESQLKLTEGTKKTLQKGEEIFASSERVLKALEDPEVREVAGGTSGFVANIAASDALDKVTLGQAERLLTPAQLQYVRDLGLFFQKFRKETTGAAASYQELAYLRPLMPSPTDTIEQQQRSFEIAQDSVRVARAKRIADEAMARRPELRDEFLNRRSWNDAREEALAREIVERGGRVDVRSMIEELNPDVEELLVRDQSGQQVGDPEIDAAVNGLFE